MISDHIVTESISGHGQKTRDETGLVLPPTQGSHLLIQIEWCLAVGEDFSPAIRSLQTMIEAEEEKLRGHKRTANSLCALAGQPPLYPDVDSPSATARSGSVRPDEYYGQPLAGAIRTILTSRKASGQGAATVKEIYDTLVKGGFKFDAKDENAIRGLRQSLTKNSQTFHKLPNGTYGLLEWYPNAKPARPDDDDEG